MKTETKINNRLWQARHRAGLEQKQVARLLGHKNCDQISRYERGARLPSLRIALKLELIYHTPISNLFPEHYQKYRAEIAATDTQSDQSNELVSGNEDEKLPDAHICTYDNLLLRKKPTAVEINAARKHSIRLIQTISDVIRRRQPTE